MPRQESSQKGGMTVQEAGHMGGTTVARKYGHEHFQQIGRKGGQRVKKLIEEAKQQEGRSSR